VLSFRKKSTRQKGITSIHVQPDGVAFAHVSRGAQGAELTRVEFIKIDQPYTNIPSVVAQFEKAQLSGNQCSLVLSLGEYQLLLVEAPEVPKEELKEALLWRIKDLIHFSPDDALLDYVELPEDAYRGRGAMVYVVVAEKRLINQRVEWLEAVGLVPRYIDIPELALLNITESVCESEAGTATLFLEQQLSIVNMMSSGALYMSRTLNYPHETHIDNTVLDLQRSMDYFESQIGKPPCVRIVVMPLQVGETPLMMELRNNLGADVQSLDLGDFVQSQISLSVDLQQRCCLAIAGAFRESGVGV